MNKPIIGICGHAGSGKDTAADFLVEHHGFVKLALADEMKRFCRKVFGFSLQQLWGASELRNIPDERFRTSAAWDEAFEAVGFIGPEWSKRLVPNRRGGVALISLCKWVSDLRVKYGPSGESTNRAYFTFSPRIALQTLGTEWGRGVDQDMWIRKAMLDAQRLLDKRQPNHYSQRSGIIEDALSHWKHYSGVVISDVRFINEVMAITEHGGQAWRLRRDGTAPTGIPGHASESEQDRLNDSEFTHVIDVATGVPAFQQQLDALMKRTQESK